MFRTVVDKLRYRRAMRRARRALCSAVNRRTPPWVREDLYERVCER